MLEFLRRTWDQITGFFRRMPVPNRVAILSLSAALVAVLVLFLTMSAKDDKVPLVTDPMDPTQANNVIKKLEEKAIPYELRAGRIYVQPEQRDALLITMYGEGVITADDATYYKWVFEQDISETRGRRDMKWIVSRQGALAKMISSLDAVESAMVTLTRQPETLFEGVERVNAAVRLKLKPGKSLGDDTVFGIAKWVAFSVQGMKPQDVAIMDTAGTMYDVAGEENGIRGGTTMLKLIAAWEKYYEDRVKKFIAAQFGSQAGVLAHVEMEFAATRLKEMGPTEPSDVHVKKKEISETSETTQGPPGVDGEGGGTRTTPVNGATGAATALGTKTTKTEKENEVDVDVPRRELETTTPPGIVKTLSLVIAAPYERLSLRPDGRSLKDEEKEKQVNDAIALWKKELPTGLGITPKDIEIIPSYYERLVEPEKPTPTQATLWWFESHWAKIALVVLSLVAVFFIWRVLRTSAPDATEEELERLRADLKASEPQQEEVLVPAGEEKTLELKERIRDAVKRNPRTAASLLKGWIKKGT